MFKFKSQDELSALWAEYGENMFWRHRHCMLIAREVLEAREDGWLGAADEDVFYRSAAAGFIVKNYSDDEK